MLHLNSVPARNRVPFTRGKLGQIFRFASISGNTLMAKLRKKGPRRLHQTKASSSQALNGDLFRIVAETATDVIVTIDEQSRILFVNSASKTFLVTLPRN